MSEQIVLADGTVIPVAYVAKGEGAQAQALPAQPLPHPELDVTLYAPATLRPGQGNASPQLSESERVAMLGTGVAEVWLGFTEMLQDLVLFPSELEALRWAVEKGGKVAKVKVDGTPVWPQLGLG